MLNLDFVPFPVLETERLVLRELSEKDAVAIKQLRSDERVNEFLERPPCLSLEDAKTFIAKIRSAIAASDSIYWVVSQKDSTDLIGTICLYNVSITKEMAELGYELMPEFQGMGIMQEAVAKVIEYGFDCMNLKVLVALPDKANLRSIHLLEKKQFQLDVNHQHIGEGDAEGMGVYVLERPK